MSKFLSFFENEVFRRWLATAATILFAALVLPTRIGRALEHPTVWNWAFVAVVLLGVVTFAADAISLWRAHLNPGSKPDRPFTAPEDVPASDVRSAISSTENRVSAVKALREQHPGLGLKAAADLVDAALDDRG